MTKMMYAGAILREPGEAGAVAAFCRAEMDRLAAADAAGLEDVRQLLAAQKARTDVIERRRNRMLEDRLRKLRRQVLRPRKGRVKRALLVGWAVVSALIPEWIRDHRNTVDRGIYWSALIFTTALTAVALLEFGIVWGWW